MARRKKWKGGSQFVKLPFYTLEHPAYQALSNAAKVIYTEIKHRFNGMNNGHIGLSCRDAADAANCTYSTASAKLQELQRHGFIKCRRQGHFKNRKASEWILTCEEFNNQPPSNEWKQYQPKQKKPRNDKRNVTCEGNNTNDYLEEQLVRGE